MKYKTYKKTNKDYQDIFSARHETKEIILDIENTLITIREHQHGIPLNEVYVDVTYKGDTYSMSFENFIKNGIGK